MSYATNQFFEFILYRLVENLILRKNQEKKVSEVSRFSGYSGFDGSPVSEKNFFSFF